MYNADIGKYYKDASDNRYLGAFVRLDSRVRDSSAGTAGQSLAPIYVFEKETLQDMFPATQIIEVLCQ